MYRLLIVDDEKIIVEGLAIMFNKANLTEVEIYTASSGRAALEIAQKLRIDILLSDIAMPEMDGIKLQEEMTRRWPRCRVVFLSGYNDFQYVQYSLRGGAIDYVLKTEGDAAIVAAVSKAITEVESELKQDGLMERARIGLQIALPVLRKEYILELLAGASTTLLTRQRRFEELGISLRWDQPLVMLAGRVDEWRKDLQTGDRELFLYSVNNIFEELIGTKYNNVFVVYSHNRFIWIMQEIIAPSLDNTHMETTVPFLSGMVEALQEACSQFLKLTCSYIIGNPNVDWDDLHAQMERFSFLFAVGLGSGSEILLADHSEFNQSIRVDRTLIHRIPLLGQHLDDKDRDAFAELFGEICESVRGYEHNNTAIGYKLEVFSTIGAVFAAYLNRRGLFNDFASKLQIRKLFNIEEHESWEAVVQYWIDLENMIMERGASDNELEVSAVVRKLHDYIEGHLEEPLSLTQLADVVYLTPSYLSRLYKFKTGMNVTEYIIQRKIREAKRLLSETHDRIQTIGESVGYPSPSYFSRFFKRETGMTPQEYRDASKNA